MSIENGLATMESFKAKDYIPPTSAKTQRPTSNGVIGGKKSGGTKK